MPAFDTISQSPSFPLLEESCVQLWKDLDALRLQNELAKERGDKEYTFYDGPPFATGEL